MVLLKEESKKIEESTKLTYVKPALKVIGSASELTKGNEDGAYPDCEGKPGLSNTQCS